MPWRRSPRTRFRYWTKGRPSDAKAAGFKTILVYCLGDMPSGERSWHSATVPLDRLPDWIGSTYARTLIARSVAMSAGLILARLTEVIDYNKGIGS